MSSDEEMPPGMENVGKPAMGDDDSDDEADMGYKPEALPDGVKKEVITAGTVDTWKKPKAGNEVIVHYVGTLDSDGSEFDSSRGRGEPFKFELGKGRVIKGWDLGVATMSKGEVSKFTLAPEFAYGEAGSPPKIPANATLVFEVELIGWISKDDLFQDEGVIKSLMEEGKGWKSPKDGDEVRIIIKATAADGTVLEDKQGFEYVIGSDALGPVAKSVNKALLGMKKGEVASLKCAKDYAYGDRTPDGATVDLTLLEIYETKDVSMAKDKTVMKKQVKEGDGWDTPKEGNPVKLSIEAVTNGNSEANLPGFGSSPQTLEFVAGNGQVCEALEAAAREMKRGERAIITCTKPGLWAGPESSRLGLDSAEGLERVVFTAELAEFEKGKDTWSMSEEEKLDFGLARKEVGADLFKRGKYAMALQRYKAVLDVFSHIDNFKPETKERAAELKRICELNKAACLLKEGDYLEAKNACDKVLIDSRDNVKALFRRATAQFHRGEYHDAMRDVDRVLELDPENAEAKRLSPQVKRAQRGEDKKAKSMYANMCKGLGKLKTPSAQAAQREGNEDGPADVETFADEVESAQKEVASNGTPVATDTA